MKDYFKKELFEFNSKKLWLFDMDGTIYLGDKLFDGVLKLLEKIEKNGGKYVFITNNSSKSVNDYVKKVNKMGIKADKDNFFTSSNATVMMLLEKYKNACIYAQGTASFIEELKGAGLNITTEYDENATCVVVGFDTEINGEKLVNTSKTLTLNKVDYFATNPDWVCPTEFGYIPDCGSMCQGYERATGKKPIFIGKPQPTMILKVMEKFGYSKEQTVVLGDRIYTDIASGVNAGVDTVLVLSGEATLKDYNESDKKPTFVLNHVNEFLKG